MKSLKKMLLLIALIGMVIAGAANAATPVSGDLSGSTHWTKAGHPYNLVGQVNVLPGATLIIDAGVVIASKPADQGSLAICNGAKIFVNGTESEPVIMTSTADVALWTGSIMSGQDIVTMGDPKTGVWRAVCQEWGNLTIMGNGYISASHYSNVPVTWSLDADQVAGGGDVTVYTNTKTPNALNKKVMEGLVPAFTGHSAYLYGGNNDDDNSGKICYLSLRYGGKVTGVNSELNGLSLGAVGRATDISHVEIMNNVDDGIEIWGGTVCLDHIAIWNIGDDSLDIDEGWRGSASYGLIVQGYSRLAKQGSGFGDNAFETDGAEDADAQPMTTTRISKFTVVGQPGATGGDAGTAWRDNARVQYSKCIWMNCGDDIVKFDDNDGDGADGYDADGNNSVKQVNNVPADGTLNWYQHWTTSYNDWKASAAGLVNLGTKTHLNLYENYMNCGCCNDFVYDVAGNLCQIQDSVMYANTKYTMYDEVTALTGAKNTGNVRAAANMPIQALTRDPIAATVYDSDQSITLSMNAVTFINPCAANDAITKDAGGFSVCHNWLADWTAADAYNMTDTSMNDITHDTDCSGQVNITDFAEFSSQWLM